ncbi:MAG: hypothetical protein EBV03_04910 [Proteobacteria bacterium]|nr:hypothetical protein [Pseudomonadota bacterium]
MLVTSEKDVLRAFSDGHIGWREACRRLDLDHFSQLEALMKRHQLAFYQPDRSATARRMSDLDKLLYPDEA